MNLFHLKFETKIHGREKKLGQLKGVVVNEEVTQVTSLILGQGVFFKQARVLPLTAVESARLDKIILNLYSDEVELYPVFEETKVKNRVVQPRPLESVGGIVDMQFQGATYLPPETGYEEKVVQWGINESDRIWNKETVIYSSQEEEVGHLFQVVVEAEDGAIRKLVMAQGGRLQRLLTIPPEVIMDVNETAVTLDMENGKIEELVEFFNFAPEPAPVGGTKIPLSLQDEDPLVTPLAEELLEILATDPRTELAFIDLVYDRGVVTLMGTVADAETKEAVADLVSQHPSVLTLHNELKIES